MARQIKANDRDERKWHLLALKRANDLESRMQERRAFVVEQLARADAALQAGRPTESVKIRATLMEMYSHYTDLADLLGPPPQTPRPAALAPDASLLPTHPAGDVAPGQPFPPSIPEAKPSREKTSDESGSR